nr:ribonuclease H-like domain-containing protein [Tanacetum cinerariifolium]
TSNFTNKVATIKVKKVNAVQGTKGNWVWKPKCTVLDHVSKLTSASMTLKKFDYTDALGISKSVVAWTLKKLIEDMLHLVDPKGGKIISKGKIKTGKLDFDDVYFVKELKFNLFSVSQMCDKKNSVLFTDTEYVVLSSDFKLPDDNHVLLRVPRQKNMYNVDLKNADEGFLIGYSVNSKAFRVFNSRTGIVQETLHINFLENQPNVAGSGPTWMFDIDADVAFDVKENENVVHVSPSSSDKPKKHDEKDKGEAKGKSPVDLSTRVRDLIDEFEEFFVNTTNRVTAASAPVTVVGQNPANNTISFTAASPTDTVVNPNFEIGGKSSFVDPFQYPNDPDMPAFEDIVYSDDEEDVGADADFSNLETNIYVSPIPTTIVHKDHLVS